MALELVTGKAGAPHIDGNDIGTINQATRGKGSYVLEFGDNLTARVTGSNSVQIGTGCASMEGRDFIISAAETVTITSGSQSMKRNDLICAHYHRDSSTGVETMGLVVLKGAAVSSNPSDPTVPSGTIMGGSLDAYWPLYRVPLDGITMGTPIKLFDNLPTLRDVGDSITHTTQSIPWKVPFTDGKISLQRTNNLVVANGNVKFSQSGQLNYSKVSETIPEGYRPIANTMVIHCGGGGTDLSLLVDANGSVSAIGNPNSAYATLQGAWFTA